LLIDVKFLGKIKNKNVENAAEKYSLALSLLRILIIFPNWFLISLKKDING